MEQYDARVDVYIAKSADFAKPILTHIRQVVHQASPLITETIKWGMPFFDYKGPVCQMAAFNQHCAFGFWKASRLYDPGNLLKIADGSAGSFGRIEGITDLPATEALIYFVNEAIQLNESGERPAAKPAKSKPEIAMPGDFEALLNEHANAKEIFEHFSPSHKREYLEWIVNAKTGATRQKRMQTAIAQITESKSRNWKYQ